MQRLPRGPIAFLAALAGIVLLLSAVTGGREPPRGELRLSEPPPAVQPAHAATPLLRTARFADGNPAR